MRPFSYDVANDPAAAIELASVAASAHVTSPVQYIGGGTTLIDLMKLDVMRPTKLVDITSIRDEGMRNVVRADGGLRIGSLVSMAQLHEDATVVRDYPLLTEGLWKAASQQLRNMARLGGNVLQRTRCGYFRDTSYAQCNKRNPGSGCSALNGANREHAILGTSTHCIAVYPSDWAPALIALDAKVEIANHIGRHQMPFSQLHRLPENTPHIETNLRPGDLITAFIIPVGPQPRSLYLKIRDRESYQFANAGVAVALELDGDVVRNVRIGLGGMATTPWRAHQAELSLRGKKLTEASAIAAADAELKQARTRKGNAAKLILAKRAITRALLQAQSMEVA